MKTWVIIMMSLCSLSMNAFADLKENSLKVGTMISQEAAMLLQVDTVSLYLKSKRVGYAARLAGNNVMEVELTVLDNRLIGNPSAMHHFVNRQIKTFIKVLSDRLAIYAPELAAEFNASKDLSFVITSGRRRALLGYYTKAMWHWESGYVPAGQVIQARSAPDSETRASNTTATYPSTYSSYAPASQLPSKDAPASKSVAPSAKQRKTEKSCKTKLCTSCPARY